MRVRLCARRRRPFLRNRRSRTTALALFAVARRRDPGSNPGSRRRDARLSASFTYRVVLLILVGSTPLDRVRCGTRPGVDLADPSSRDAGVLLANNPRTERTIAHHDRSIVHVRSSPPPWVARRSEGGGGESVINRFAAVPSGLVRGGTSTRFARLLVSRRRRSYFSSSSSRRGERAVHPSAHRPVARLLESCGT